MQIPLDPSDEQELIVYLRTLETFGTSAVQRRFKINYFKAATLVENLSTRGLIAARPATPGFYMVVDGF